MAYGSSCGPKDSDAKPRQGHAQWSGERSDAWLEYESLVNDQKFEEASRWVERRLKGAKDDPVEATRCLIRLTQLRMALHGYETAVKMLREAQWPKDPVAEALLSLYYAHALRFYAQRYAWEIRKREQVQSGKEVDLKAWTMEQINDEARAAFARAFWQRRGLQELPVRSLREFITPNAYPEGIRPTVRDAVTYMFASMLADSGTWTVEQESEVWRLDLAKLLGEPKELEGELDLSRHPLEIMVDVLGDLEAWHLSRGEKEAAFEARLERLRHLHEAFKEDFERAPIRRDLENRLEGVKGLPWWAMGMAELASFVMREDAPDSLLRAHEIARRCLEAMPDTPGGERCFAIEKDIESPHYALEAMASDGPQRRSIGVRYKNLRRLYFRAYPVDLLKHIGRSKDYSIMPTTMEVEGLLTEGKPSHEWAVDLEETADFREHIAYTTPPMTKSGLYVVVASAREDFDRSDNELLAVPIVISDLVLVTRTIEDEVEVQVLSGSSGRPVEGAKVVLYRYDWRQGHRPVEERLSRKDGKVTFELNCERCFLVAIKGEEVAIEPRYLYLEGFPTKGPTHGVLVYTDRSVYRPLQTVRFKVVAFEGNEERTHFKVAQDTEVRIALLDANGQEVEAKTLKTNKFGTVSGEFVIPSGRLLGRWSVRTEPEGYATIYVEEYKRPTFEVRVLDPSEPLRLNRPAVIRGEATYYFGLPVARGEARYRITREPVLLDWWWDFWPFRPKEKAQVVASGKTSLDEKGRFEVAFTPEADERLSSTKKVLTYRYVLEVDVTDEGGETRSARKAFRVGFVSVEARVDLETGFLREGVENQVKVTRTDLNGTPAPGKGKWRLLALRGPKETLLPADQPLPEPPQGTFQTKGDRLRPRWDPKYDPFQVMGLWQDGEEVAQGEVEHGQDGAALLKLPGLKAGAYRLRYSTTDAFGSPYEMAKDFVVAGPKIEIPLPALVLVERGSVKVGETARLVIYSGLEDQPIRVDVYQDGKRLRTLPLSSPLVEIPITEDLRGGFSISVDILRDHQFLHYDVPIMVPWDNKELKVTFETFRDLLRPRAQERWVVKVADASGKDAAVAGAEVLAYMYDRALDLFAPHLPPSPLSLYAIRDFAPEPLASLRPAEVVYVRCYGFREFGEWREFPPDSIEFYPEYGIGGPGARRFVRKKAMREVARDRARVPRVEAPAPKEVTLEEGEAEESVVFEAPRGAYEEAPKGPAERVELRTDFAETAFFEPHLITGPDGTAAIEFTVPDSVTGWNVFVHAITEDLRSGSLKGEAKTVKDMMVRPYLPRFLREGDEVEVRVVVNNATDHEVSGTVDIDIEDPSTGQSLLKEFGLVPDEAKGRGFTAKPGQGASVAFRLRAPSRVGLVAFKAVARSGIFSDGEVRPIPILPGRMHLAQSRFVTLKDAERRVMRFEDLEKAALDPTLVNEQLVVTVDAQLFYSVLSALPYLVNYPYECTEQTLNRFLSTGIMASFFDKYPALAKMAEEFSKRTTRYESWDKADPNRKMMLEETPWVVEARGGEEKEDELINVLDPKVARAQRDEAIEKLRKAQTEIGGFPWFPSGPPSPYMTLYILYGFSKGLEFGVEVPKEMVQRAWQYLHRHYVDEVVRVMMAHECCFEFVTFLNYVLSQYPDESWTGGVFSEEEREAMVNYSFKHWRRLSPYSKGQLALTLHRMGRKGEARLVWASVMDSARTEKDQGTFWQPEERAWLWYNDTIETHAFALRTLLEIDPENEKIDGLVLWLFLNKKLNHWKSTRATAEVIYSLAHYLKKKEQISVREEATVKVGGREWRFVFEPDRYTGKKNQVVIPGEEIRPQSHAEVVVEKATRGYMFASATWHFSTERMPKEARGDFISITRTYYLRDKTGQKVVLRPLEEGTPVRVGDEVEVHLSIRTKHPMEYVHLRDPRPAGFEPVSLRSSFKWDLGIGFYEEVRDSGENFFFESLPHGEYTFKYRIRAAQAGTFKVAPATIQPMYAPEFAAYSAGDVITVGE